MSLRVDRVGPAVVLTVDRLATHNSIDLETAAAIGEAVRAAGEDRTARGVVLTGAGDRTFLSGGDLRMLARALDEGASPELVLGMFEPLSACERGELPVIAAVQGDAFGGGCELLLLCDLVVVESHARLSFRHAKMGLVPAWGGLTRLVERAGPGTAARLLYTADPIDAAEAARVGLADEVVPKGWAKARAIELVDRIAESPRGTVGALKKALYAVREERRGASRDREREAFEERWGGPDHRAAIGAFLAKK